MFHASCPARNWKVGFDVLADAVMNATFPKNEWARERDVILREFAMGKDNPDREIYKLLSATAYRVHPYRIPVIGYEDVFKSATHADLVKYFRRNYTPDNMIVVVVGDVSAAEVEARVRETFKSFTRRSGQMAPLPAEPPQIAPRFARKTGAYNVSRLLWGYHTVALNDPDAAALDVLADIVGSGRSSRLVKKIKEEQKLVHEIDAWSMTAKDPGLFGFSATFDPTNEAAVISAIQEEVDGWAAGAFSSEELEKAKRAVLVGELAGLQTMDGQAYSYGVGRVLRRRSSFSERYLENVQAVDAGKLKDVARRYLSAANRTARRALAGGNGRDGCARAAGRGRNRRSESDAVQRNSPDRPRGPPPAVRLFLRGAQGRTADRDGNEQRHHQPHVGPAHARHGTARTRRRRSRRPSNSSAARSRRSAGATASGSRPSACRRTPIRSWPCSADCLLNSTFPEDEIEKQKLVQLSAIQQQREQPFFIAEEALRQTLFPNHPYRWTPQGSRETVQRLDRSALAGHFKQQSRQKQPRALDFRGHHERAGATAGGALPGGSSGRAGAAIPERAAEPEPARAEASGASRRSRRSCWSAIRAWTSETRAWTR